MDIRGVQMYREQKRTRAVIVRLAVTVHAGWGVAYPSLSALDEIIVTVCSCLGLVFHAELLGDLEGQRRPWTPCECWRPAMGAAAAMRPAAAASLPILTPSEAATPPLPPHSSLDSLTGQIRVLLASSTG